MSLVAAKRLMRSRKLRASSSISILMVVSSSLPRLLTTTFSDKKSRRNIQHILHLNLFYLLNLTTTQFFHHYPTNQRDQTTMAYCQHPSVSIRAVRRFCINQYILLLPHHHLRHHHQWEVKLARSKTTRRIKTFHSCILHWTAQAIALAVKVQQVCKEFK